MTKENKHSSLPPFLALCKLASKESWCWDLTCTTCSHSHFRYAFKELISGKHPNKVGWEVNKNTRITRSVVRMLPSMGSFTEHEQEILSQLVLEVSLEEIRTTSKSPDWLGYLGLVLVYCNNRKVQLSEVWTPQFLRILPQSSRAYDAMQDIKRGVRSIELDDLEAVEKAFYGISSSSIRLLAKEGANTQRDTL